MDRVVDLRSDTVTEPTPAMRRAMAEAVVGDDVYGEDPTVNRLEERAAELLEREAAVFVPSGTMGNQTAIHLHCRPGHEVIGEADSHVFHFEMGAMSALTGAFPRPVRSDRGILRPEELETAIQPKAGYRTPAGMVVLENSHNLAGGRVTPPGRMAELVAVAQRHGLPVHLDGARLHNAAAALGLPAAELARGCATVMFCLSKGLGAPVGSVLVGDRDAIAEARRIRKMFGGGMRQVGILAAAGLVALDEVLPRLGDDNRRAKRLADLLGGHPGRTSSTPPWCETNIVFFGLAPSSPVTAGELARRLAAAGVLVHALGASSVRMVTHHHVTDDDVEVAAGAVRKVLAN